MKEVESIIGLAENRDMLERWLGTGPEINHVVGSNDNDNYEELPLLEEGYASQHRFLRHSKDLMEVSLSIGNPFEEHSGDLFTLDNKVRESAAAAVSVHKFESVRQEQYNQ